MRSTDEPEPYIAPGGSAPLRWQPRRCSAKIFRWPAGWPFDMRFSSGWRVVSNGSNRYPMIGSFCLQYKRCCKRCPITSGMAQTRCNIYTFLEMLSCFSHIVVAVAMESPPQLGLFLPLLVSFGPIWLLLVSFGPFWSLLVPFCLFWSLLVPFCLFYQF